MIQFYRRIFMSYVQRNKNVCHFANLKKVNLHPTKAKDGAVNVHKGKRNAKHNVGTKK